MNIARTERSSDERKRDKCDGTKHIDISVKVGEGDDEEKSLGRTWRLCRGKATASKSTKFIE